MIKYNQEVNEKMNYLKKLRIEKKLKQTDIAKELCMSQPMYNRYEKFDTKSIPNTILEKLASILDTTPEKIKMLHKEHQEFKDTITTIQHKPCDLSHFSPYCADFIRDIKNKDIIMEALLDHLVREPNKFASR